MQTFRENETVVENDNLITVSVNKFNCFKFITTSLKSIYLSNIDSNAILEIKELETNKKSPCIAMPIFFKINEKDINKFYNYMHQMSLSKAIVKITLSEKTFIFTIEKKDDDLLLTLKESELLYLLECILELTYNDDILYTSIHYYENFTDFYSDEKFNLLLSKFGDYEKSMSILQSVHKNMLKNYEDFEIFFDFSGNDFRINISKNK